MAKIIFEKKEEEIDNSLYERMQLKANSKIAPLTCPNHKEAFAHIRIGANKRNFSFDITHARCPEFLELAKKAVYPIAE